MPPGPPPTPSHLKLLRGNPGKRRVTDEPQPRPFDEAPDPPSYITGYAAEEWKKVAPELHRLGVLTSLDVAALAAYCWAYASWRDAVEMVAEQAATSSSRGLLVSTPAGLRRNPLVVAANQAAAEMLRFAAEFGLTPIARARLGAAGWQPPSGGGKFSGYLSDG